MIYENIKEIAAGKGISINQLEKDLHFGKAVISKWNRNRPSVDKVAQVARYLGIPIEELIKDDVREKDDG